MSGPSSSSLPASTSRSGGYPSLDAYALSFRSELRDQGRTALAPFADLIQTSGYDWLDAFMETALEGASSGAPLTQLIKTPSRTATAKKTRATRAAGKERADKLKAINSENPAIGSPTSKLSTNKEATRLPLSPLQPRAINSAALTPRSPLGASSKQNIITISASPSPSPTPVKAKGKAKKAAAKPPAKAPKGGKRGKAKQPDSDAENRASPDEAESSANSSQLQDDGLRMEVDERAPAPTPAKARQPVSKPAPAPSPVPEPMESEAEESEEAHDVDVAEDVQISITVDDEAAPSAPAANGTNGPAPVRHDLSVIAEEDSSARTDTSLRAASKEVEKTDVEASAKSAPVARGQESAEPKVPESAAPPADRPSSRPTLFTRLEQRESTNATASASTTAAPADAPPPVPLHNVRSSWLRSALGGSGASSAADSNRDSLRQSYAAHSARQPSLGFEGLRKSLAPAGGFGSKRKSEEGGPEEARSEKIAKIELATGVAAVAPRSTIMAVQPSKDVAADGPGTATAVTRNAKSDGVPPQRPEMDKVAQALDQLRQQNQQKELNRQKAAAQGAATPAGDRASNQPAASGSGFLMRGLTNLGSGLGRSLGLGSTARNADLDNEKNAGGDDQPEGRPAPPRPKTTTASLFSRPMAVVAPPVRDRESAASLEDEETQDENQVMQDLEFVTAPLAPLSMLPAAQADRPKPAATQPEMKQVRQAAVVQAPPASPLRVTRQALQSTTPSGTPPRPGVAAAAALSPSQARSARSNAPSTASDLLPRQSFAQVGQQPPSRLVHVATASAPVARPEQRSSRDAEEEDESMEDERDEQDVQRENFEADEHDGYHSDDEPTSRPVSRPPTQMSRAPSSASLYSLGQTSNASSSTAVTASGSIFNHAHKMAEKAMGIKPSVAPVRSIQLAQSVAKKDLAASERRIKEREQTEQRKRELAEKRAEADRLKAEEVNRAKNAEMEERKRQRAADERRRREQEERKAAILREKRRREEEEKERDALNKQKAAEEQERKRRIAAQQKTAQALQAAQAAQAAQTAARQKAAAMASGSSAPPVGAVQKAKAALPIIKPMAPSAAAAGPSKPVMHGPSVFRTTATATAQEQVSSTITLVTQQQQQQQQTAPRPLGPPSRPSAMLSQQGTAPLRTSVAVQHQHHSVLQQQQAQAGPSSSSAVLQHSRVVLQSQLDERAAEIASEDIELPDIASEYSNSDDDEDERAKGFVRPDWAMSPALRAQLAAQSTRDPDELFGPIKPPNMEELFKARHNKFRKRTSSANWAKGDGLTKEEEREYARKMGFRPMGE